MKIFTKPNTGLIGDSFDVRDHIGVGLEIPLGGGGSGDISPLVEIKNNGKRVDLYNTHHMKQGKGTVTCTSYSATHARVIMKVLLSKDKNFFLNPEQQVINQKEYPGTWIEGVGDYLNSPWKAMKETPLKWTDPKNGITYDFGITEYKTIDISLWKHYLKMGYPFITGGRFSSNPVDKDKYLNFGTTFGHAICCTGFDDIKQRFEFVDSSGLTKDGRVYVDYQEAPEMFRGWVGIPN